MADQHGAFNYGALYGYYNIAESGFFRDKGRFNAMSGEFGRLNATLADELQRSVAHELRESLKRPGVSTGMLERAILDQQNRQSGYTGFGVGIPSFLDKSAAKYWEQIESGSTVHVGKRMQGLWANAISYNGPDYERGDQESQRSLRGGLSGFGPPSGQGFRPFTRAQLREALRGRRGKRPGTRGIIRRPIEPHEYFEKGWDAWGGIGEVQKRYDALLRAHGLTPIWHSGRFLRQLPPGANGR